MPPPWTVHNFNVGAIRLIFEVGNPEILDDDVEIDSPIARIQRAGVDDARNGPWPKFAAHALLNVLYGDHNDTFTVREAGGDPVVYVRLVIVAGG